MPDDTFRYLADGLTDEVLAQDDRAVLRTLRGPTLVRFPGGDHAPPRAVSTLLHGDEPTGFQAMLHLLRERPRLPSTLYLFVGNVRAALAPPGYAHRYLDDQEDLNRIWAPSAVTTPLRDAAAQALQHLRDAGCRDPGRPAQHLRRHPLPRDRHPGPAGDVEPRHAVHHPDRALGAPERRARRGAPRCL